jgi:hypothetical protein
MGATASSSCHADINIFEEEDVFLHDDIRPRVTMHIHHAA